MREYLSSLRVGCVEAYAGIVQGMKGENNNIAGDGNPLIPLAGTILSPLAPFLALIASDHNSSDECVSHALGLVGFVPFFIHSLKRSAAGKKNNEVCCSSHHSQQSLQILSL